MKKNFIKRLLLLSFLILSCLTIFAVQDVAMVRAEDIVEPPVVEEEDSNIEYGGFQVGTNLITDEYLYTALLRLAKNLDGYTGSTLYSEMFLDVEEIVIEKKNVSSLSGLEYLELPNLKRLKLKKNAIASIDSEIFEAMPNLQELDLSDNKIETIDLTECTNLTSLNLKNNKISEIDLENVSSESLEIDLSNNNFSEMAKIVLPISTCDNINLNILSNNIIDITDEYFDVEGLTIKAGIQGLKSSVNSETKEEQIINLTTKYELKVYKIGFPNYAINIYKADGDKSLVKTIADSEIDGDYIKLELGVGNYKYVYVVDGVEINPKLNTEYSNLGTYQFVIRPAAANYLFEYNGKTYEEIGKITGKVKVLLSCEDGGTIFYSLNGNDWVQGNEVMCDKGGAYNISVKVEKDGLESSVRTIHFQTSLNTIIPDGLMLVLVLLLAVTIFVVIVPLVSKKFFNKD